MVFDINLRQHFYSEEVIVESLKKCNVLKINDEELVVVSRMFGYPELSQTEACRRILETYGLKMLILTCGTEVMCLHPKKLHSSLPLRSKLPILSEQVTPSQELSYLKHISVQLKCRLMCAHRTVQCLYFLQNFSLKTRSCYVLCFP